MIRKTKTMLQILTEFPDAEFDLSGGLHLGLPNMYCNNLDLHKLGKEISTAKEYRLRSKKCCELELKEV